MKKRCHTIQKLLGYIIVTILILIPFSIAQAQEYETPYILPDYPAFGVEDCNDWLRSIEDDPGMEDTIYSDKQSTKEYLACGIKSGRIRMHMIPFYIVYFIEFLVSMAGIVAVLFIIIGGFYYATSGVSDKKDLGKSTIMNGLIGFALVTIAWVIVNIVQILLTQ